MNIIILFSLVIQASGILGYKQGGAGPYIGQTGHFVSCTAEQPPTSTTAEVTACVPYSIQPFNVTYEFRRFFIPNPDFDRCETDARWEQQNGITKIDACAAKAAELKHMMFFFDGDICKTSPKLYQFQDVDCDDLNVTMVYTRCFEDLQDTACTVAAGECFAAPEGDLRITGAQICGQAEYEKCIKGKYVKFIAASDTNSDLGTDVLSNDYLVGRVGCFFTSGMGGDPNNIEATCDAAGGATACAPQSEADLVSFIAALDTFITSTTEPKLQVSLTATNDIWVWGTEVTQPSDTQGSDGWTSNNPDAGDIYGIYVGGNGGGLESEKSNYRGTNDPYCCYFPATEL